MQGQLFTQDFLLAGIRATDPYAALSDAVLSDFRQRLDALYGGVSGAAALNEAQTEATLLVPTLQLLGWSDWLPQVNASGKGRESVPDFLLFPDADAKSRALRRRDQDRYRDGIAIVEAKRWGRPLDRADDRDPTDPGAPSSQMLRYLSRVDVASDRAVKWGVLTNGAVWRLYWQDARSRVEDFFEIHLAAVLGLTGAQPDIDDALALDPEHGLRVFFLLFHRAAFLTQTWDRDRRSFHAYALAEARHYEESVSNDLGQRVFAEVFPALASAVAHGDPAAERGTDGRLTRPYLQALHEATLVFLYRLLFVFYAEDRHLLPVADARYRRYSIRNLRDEVRDRRVAGQAWSSVQSGCWDRLRNLFDAIAQGDDSTGLPAYNGGLFESGRAPILDRARVPDAALAPLIDALSCRTDVLRGYINYRDLSVSHLGGIYERLLEFVLVDAGQSVVAAPASFARRTTGSYYTHDALVKLILRESVGRLIEERVRKFEALIKRLRGKHSLSPPEWEALGRADPAAAILELAVCDPAMGSGHFLVALVDQLADGVLEAMNDAEQRVAEQPWSAHLAERGIPWLSPLAARIAEIRRRIQRLAAERRWTVSAEQLDDRHIVRRMVLKKCVYGVDKNPMAVELAKVALWLHTFTVGAPLSFLDHHLRWGDSLHGEKLDTARRDIEALGVLMQETELSRMEAAARALAQVADLTDVDIAESHLSRQLAGDAQAHLAPIQGLLDFWRALRWLVPGWPTRRLERIKDDSAGRALAEVFSGRWNVIGVIERGHLDERGADPLTLRDVQAANALIADARALSARERFFHWWTAFAAVFARGGFDAVVGNPPWDRIKLQQVEWFAERRPEIAMQPRAADRKRMIERLVSARDPLAQDYAQAAERAEMQARVLREAGDYPLLSGGDINLYSLFVERAQALVRDSGIVALLTPSGIAADKGAAEFFKGISVTGRLAALYDFENRNNPGGSFFPDVDSRFKFCTLVFGGKQRRFDAAACAFYLHAVEELAVDGRVLALRAQDFALVNPNTGAAPVFRNARDAGIVTAMYRRRTVLVDRSQTPPRKAWPVRYVTMFHMTNDSGLFLRRDELLAQDWQPAPPNDWRRGDEPGALALPLYEGKMVQMFDHRAADVVVNPANLHRAAQPRELSTAEHMQAERFALPQYWVGAEHCSAVNPRGWALGFKEITAPTNARTMIAAVLPRAGVGNTLPILLVSEDTSPRAAHQAALMLALFNSFAFDFVARQKVQGQHLNWFIVEQLPVIAPADFDAPLGNETIGDFVCREVLRLTYTAHDMAAFAKDLGDVDAQGTVRPPFVWDESDRRRRMALLDALFMHLYGIGRDDAAYILDSFPIVREKDEAAHGEYLTRRLVLQAMDEIASGGLARLAALSPSARRHGD